MLSPKPKPNHCKTFSWSCTRLICSWVGKAVRWAKMAKWKCCLGWNVWEVCEVVSGLFAMHHKSILWPQTVRSRARQTPWVRVKWTKWSSAWLAFNLRSFVNLDPVISPREGSSQMDGCQLATKSPCSQFRDESNYSVKTGSSRRRPISIQFCVPHSVDTGGVAVLCANFRCSYLADSHAHLHSGKSNKLHHILRRRRRGRWRWLMLMMTSDENGDEDDQADCSLQNNNKNI